LFRYRIYNSSCFGIWYTRRQLNKIHEKHPDGHSTIKSFTYGDITVKAVSQNSDNYSYLVMCDATDDCVVIDVGDASPILQCLSNENKVPQAVLVTHKHWDHCYGNRELKKHYKKLKIYGSEIDRPSGVNTYIRNHTLIQLGRLNFEALHVPGHTAGHMIYVLQLNDNLKCLFTGDFLFVAGIGKVFEGTPSQMIRSLLTLNDFASDTVIFPGHEYAKLNLAFALTLEGDNEALRAMFKIVHEKRGDRLPIVSYLLNRSHPKRTFIQGS
uniref:Lactamase_B domain-containing protein n=1 Tax=Thelazia callipaeda TaxID=103827 RepID=A0A0N5CSL3_THECL